MGDGCGGAEAVFCLQAEVFACGHDVIGERLDQRRLLVSALQFAFPKIPRFILTYSWYLEQTNKIKHPQMFNPLFVTSSKKRDLFNLKKRNMGRGYTSF